MEKKLYVAYGSNLNHEQMGQRCPEADFYGVGKLRGYELQFKGEQGCAFATIAPKEGSFVPVAVWEISPEDEASLDRYEGYPLMYLKQKMVMNLNGESKEAFAYVMNPAMKFGLPSGKYYNTVIMGYCDCCMDISIPDRAIRKSASECGLTVPEYLRYSEYSYGESEETLQSVEEQTKEEMDCGPMNSSGPSL